MTGTSSLHKSRAEAIEPLRLAVVTVSDTRSVEDDVNGRYLRNQIEAAGYRLVDYFVIPDDPDELSETLERLAESPAHAIVFNGGTGISSRDTTYDVLAARLEKVLPGFGELFRFLSYREIGSAAMLSRATAGIFRGKVVFSTPGSPKAVELAWNELIRPELEHLVWEVRR